MPQVHRDARRAARAVVVIAALLISGCGQPETTQPQQWPVAQAPTATIPPTIAPALDPAQAGMQSLLDLTALRSYHRRLVLPNVAEDEEQPEATLEFVEAIDRDTDLQYATIPEEFAGVTPWASLTYRDKTTIYYQAHLDGTCEAALVTPDEPMQPFIAEASSLDYIGEIMEAELVARGEVINGVVTDHFRVQVSIPFFVSLGHAGMPAPGDLWVAQDGGYMVKLAVQTTVEAAEREGTTWGEAGTYGWSYDVEAINQPVKIELPTACTDVQPTFTVLLPPDATNWNGLRYQTGMERDEVTNYYVKNYPAVGWNLADQQRTADRDWLRFENGDDAFEITVMNDPEPLLSYNNDPNELPPTPGPPGASEPTMPPLRGSIVQVLELRDGEPVVDREVIPLPPGAKLVDAYTEGVQYGTPTFVVAFDEPQTDESARSAYQATMQGRGWTAFCTDATQTGDDCLEYPVKTDPVAFTDFYRSPADADGMSVVLQVTVQNGQITIYPLGRQ